MWKLRILVGLEREGGHEREREAKAVWEQDSHADAVAWKGLKASEFLKGQVTTYVGAYAVPSNWTYGCWQCFLWLLHASKHTPTFSSHCVAHNQNLCLRHSNLLDVHTWLNMITHYVSASTGINYSHLIWLSRPIWTAKGYLDSTHAVVALVHQIITFAVHVFVFFLSISLIFLYFCAVDKNPYVDGTMKGRQHFY